MGKSGQKGVLVLLRQWPANEGRSTFVVGARALGMDDVAVDSYCVCYQRWDTTTTNLQYIFSEATATQVGRSQAA
jgi:hypothetical protein